MPNEQSDRQVVLVSGGRSGIGAAIVRDLASRGSRIAVADIKGAAPDGVGDLELSLPICDLTDPSSVTRFFDALSASGASVSALIHCAGIYPAGPFETTDVDTWRRVLATNLDSYFLLAQRVLPAMRERANGRIIAVSSNTFFDATPGLAAYIASKAGVIGLTRALAREYGAAGVTVNAIAPSITRTESTEAVFSDEAFAELVSKQAIPKLAVPEDYLGTIRFLLSEDSSFITGQTLIVDGGWTRN